VSKNNRILIIDALNLYIRNYVINPSLSHHGQPIGGVVGTFKSLQKLVRETNPSAIIVAWDGPDGSRRRKNMDKGYKAGRKPIRLNRAFHNLTDDEEIKNKIWQQSRLIEFLNEMPVMQFMFPEVEADDVISYVCQLPQYGGHQKIIVSNDKDFMQLCDEETVLWRPVKDEFMNTSRIVEQVGVHPRNMALARAIIGDASDNLPGVRGVGFKTLRKRLPFMRKDDEATLADIIEFCEKDDSKLKLFDSIVESEDLIAHNYKMMQLYSPQISIQSKGVIKSTVKNFKCEFNKTGILKMMREDGFGELLWDDLRANLNRIVQESNENK